MPFKPVGVNEQNQFPPRIMNELSKTFIKKPEGIQNGQVPIWDSVTKSWKAGSPSMGAETPALIDGGSPNKQ